MESSWTIHLLLWKSTPELLGNLTRFHNWRIRSRYICPGSEKYQRRLKTENSQTNSIFDLSSNINHLYVHKNMLHFELNERECVTEISSILCSSPVILTFLCAFCLMSFMSKWILSISINLMSFLSTSSYILPKIKSISSLKCVECLMKVFFKYFSPLYVTSTESMRRMNQNKIYKEHIKRQKNREKTRSTTKWRNKKSRI